jgi:hypothetical protein
MALMSGDLETCAHALGTYEPSYTGMHVRLSFILEAHGPLGTAGRMAARSPPSREAGSGAAGHAVHRSPPSGSGAMVHVATPEPFSSGSHVLEPLDTWKPRSPPWL